MEVTAYLGTQFMLNNVRTSSVKETYRVEALLKATETTTRKNHKCLDDPKLVTLRKATGDLVFMEQLGQALHVKSMIVVDLFLCGYDALWH